MAVDAEGAQHLQVRFVRGLTGNRQPLGQLVADTERRERAGRGQAKPKENDELLVVQRPTSDGAHGDSFGSARRGLLDRRAPRPLRRRPPECTSLVPRPYLSPRECLPWYSAMSTSEPPRG